MPEPAQLNSLENEWVYGLSGVGKSYYAHNTYPLRYTKPHNRWWDGYKDQEVVVLDDIGKSQATWVGDFLKIWADHYPFIADFKGKSRMIRPKKIVVTSNYSIEELFPDTNVSEPLLRRFKVIHMHGQVGAWMPGSQKPLNDN